MQNLRFPKERLETKLNESMRKKKKKKKKEKKR